MIKVSIKRLIMSFLSRMTMHRRKCMGREARDRKRCGEGSRIRARYICAQSHCAEDVPALSLTHWHLHMLRAQLAIMRPLPTSPISPRGYIYRKRVRASYICIYAYCIFLSAFYWNIFTLESIFCIVMKYTRCICE